MSSEANEAISAVPLPDLQDADLDPATLGQLFFDLSQLARVLEVRLKGGATDYASARPLSLEDARSALETGASHAVQIRYVYQGITWTDTLLRTRVGIRLVRMQAP